MKTSVLVVGGGVAGMVAALRQAHAGRSVTLLERQPRLGGLLGSCAVPGSEHVFDYGTHIPAETGDAALDAELFGFCRSNDWVALPALRAGNYWNGQFNAASPCVDLRSLPAERYETIVQELLRVVPEAEAVPAHAAARLEGIYGPTMCETVFAPMLRKFTGRALTELAPHANELFGLSRFVCLEAAEVRERKKDPALDRRLAFHSSRELPPGAKPSLAYYPRTGGVGRWVERLEERLVAAGVRILTNGNLRSLAPNAGRAELADGTVFAFDLLEWSLPAAQLLRLAGNPHATGFAPPAFSAIDLCHYVCDQVPATDVFYATCYDPALRTFRATLYSNLQPEAREPVRVTVEVIRLPSESVVDSGTLFDELKQMGLFHAGTSATCVHRESVVAGFPIHTTGFGDAMRRAAAAAESEYPRVRLLGRAGGQAFFMRDVLLDAWRAEEGAVTLSRSAA